MNSIRIAKVKATGKKYLVKSMYLPTKAGEKAKVFCWGDCVGFDQVSASTRHAEGSKTFLKEAVDIEEIADKLGQLQAVKELFDQHLQEKRDAGHVLVPKKAGGGVKWTDLGTKEQIAKRQADEPRRQEQKQKFDDLKRALRSGDIGEINRTLNTALLGE